MNKLIITIFICLYCYSQTSAQFSQQERDSIYNLNSVDHQLMMMKLGINELRPGPSGNPDAPNAANSDESKAKQYESLPDPLIFNDGNLVKSAEDWSKRRLEIVEDFDREVYGRLPENIPSVTWKIDEVKDTSIGIYPVHIKYLKGHVDNSSFPQINVNIEMTLTTPKDISEPVPVILEFGWVLPKGWKLPEPEGPTWQEQLLAKGWGYAVLIPTSFQADNGAGLREGIIGLVNKGQPRKPDDWGTLRAWAWGASRAIDYFETDENVDEKRIGVEGLSRYGKAAIVAMAYEPRIAVGLIGSAGAGGTKILRRIFGEQVENLASSWEYHWFAPNFINYAGPLTVNDLPVDAHQLVALCAPRPLFISAGSPDVEGNWVDAKGMFLSGVHASPVFELLGKRGLEISKYPHEGTTWIRGDIAFRQHSGGHTVGPNWSSFIEFAEKYFNK
ncbi:MAG: hypothetical protein JW995_15250 [Melioribacteraceae bacterium]|nr:hypothetical protein [Melioribacteraceae bacterium]